MKESRLINTFTGNLVEAGCDEAGRGCLAGPVFAAAVVLPKNFLCPGLNDSKQLTPAQRNKLRSFIEANAAAWAVAGIDNTMIDQINILRASFLAMHEAVKKLTIMPQLLLIDGNRFVEFPGISHQCFIKGDARFASIAAASVLAKTHRDEYMQKIHREYPVYGWDRNKGYPTPAHINAISVYGQSHYHRRSFKTDKQLRMKFG